MANCLEGHKAWVPRLLVEQLGLHSIFRVFSLAQSQACIIFPLCAVDGWEGEGLVSVKKQICELLQNFIKRGF